MKLTNKLFLLLTGLICGSSPVFALVPNEQLPPVVQTTPEGNDADKTVVTTPDVPTPNSIPAKNNIPAENKIPTQNQIPPVNHIPQPNAIPAPNQIPTTNTVVSPN